MKRVTAAERKHYDRVARLGCIVCRLQGMASRPEIHHLRTGAGAGMRSRNVIPLCPLHHRTGGYGVAIHAGREKWESEHGTELELLDEVGKMLG